MNTDFDENILDFTEEEDDTTVETPEPSTTFHVEHGRIRSKCDDYVAMKQAVDKILKTERFVYPIYTEDYGNDLETLIGSSVPHAKPEVHRMTTEALSADDRVTQVEIKEIKQTAPDVLSVSGVCYTIYGPINIDTEVVLIES